MHRHRCMSHMTHIPCRLLCNETCSYHAVVRWHRNGFPKPIPHSTQWTWTVASSQSLSKHMALLTCIIHVRWRAQAHDLNPRALIIPGPTQKKRHTFPVCLRHTFPDLYLAIDTRRRNWL